MDRFEGEGGGPEFLGVYGGEKRRCAKCGRVQNPGDIIEVVDGTIIPEENTQTEKPQEVIGGNIYCFDKVIGSGCSPKQDWNSPPRQFCYVPENKKQGP